MQTFLRQTMLATVAVFGLGTIAATAATPAPTTSQAAPAAPASAPAAKPPSMAERVNQRIAELHKKLQITSAEEPQWRRFTAVMRENDRTMDNAMRQRMDKLPGMNAEQNMKSYAHIAALHAQNMRKMLPAFEHLYHAMPAGQKQTVDQVFRNDAYRGKAARHQ